MRTTTWAVTITITITMMLVLGGGVCTEGSESAFTDREARVPTCSLGGSSGSDSSSDPLESMCQLNSTLGFGPGNRLLVRFGEGPCRVVVKDCAADACYFAQSGYLLSPPDMGVQPEGDSLSSLRPPGSVFASISSVLGAQMEWRADGVRFKPSGSKFEFVYSTVTCAQWYATRGYLHPQSCSSPVEALSVMIAGMPVSCNL